jgi:subtilisin family serine protease
VKRLSRAATLAALLAVAILGPARAQEVSAPGDTAVMLEDGSQLWFVELSSRPTTDGGSLPGVLLEQATFRAAAAGAGIRATERGAFHALWNGVSLAVRPRDVSRLRALPGVTEVYPVMAIELPEVSPTLDPALLTALSMTGADIAHADLGLTGAGVKVGIIDTGLDYDHPDLGGDGLARRNSAMFPTGRVVTGFDFVGDSYNGSNTPLPDPYPDDCSGHGTHVSGIVGASGAVTGVAPGIVFGVYRVFGCNGFTTPDILLAAMERALDDGMQVVNMSLSSAFQWPSYPVARACDRLVNRGVVVCAAFGNSGGLGLYAGGAPGVGKKVIGVAAFDNTHFNTPIFRVSPDGALFTYILGLGSPPAPLSGIDPLARTGTASSTADACTALPAGSLTGRVALIRRGTCSVHTKARNAELAGAVAVVVYNSVNENVTVDARGLPPVTIPVVGIGKAQGELLDSRLAAGPVDLTWTIASTPNTTTGGFVSDFSSYGPAPDLTLKPDLGAPGGFITSTYPLEQGGHASLSGTSMSSPHVAGAVALLLEAHPNTPASAVRTILMNNASPRPRAGAPAGLDAVHRQGAGMLDIPAAVLATTRVEPGKLELGESEAGPAVRTLTIENNGASAVSYELSNAAALATGPDAFTPTAMVGESSVSFSANPVLVAAGGTATVDVTIAPDPELQDGSLYGGYILLTPDDGGRETRVPYAGFDGDYQSAPVLTPTTLGVPWLAHLVGSSLFNQPHGASFTLQGGDIPYIVLHLDRPVSELKMEIFDASTGKAWHRMFYSKDFPRNLTAQSVSAYGWHGSTFHGNQVLDVPNGQYVVRVSVLKPLGDENDPAHSESWTSPVITLARPALAVVAGPSLSQSPVRVGDHVTVSASIRNSGASAANGVKVAFLDNGAAYDSTTLDLEPSQSGPVAVPWNVGPPATHVLEVVVDPDEQCVEIDRGDNTAETTVTLDGLIVGVEGTLPNELWLAPAWPNPFGRSVGFRFGLPGAGPVSFEIFDMLGRRLRSWRWSALPAGEHALTWDGRSDEGRHAPAGVLLLRLHASGRTLTRKAVRLP